MSAFPQDYFVKIEQDDYRVGRLTLNKFKEQYNIEIDIVQKDSKKIWAHVDILYNFSVHD